jgi:hypothetical protein
VADKVSTLDLHITDGALVLLENVDDLGQFGDAFRTGLDGSAPVALGMKANVGGLQVVNPAAGTWFALHLSGAAVDTGGMGTVDNSAPILGALSFADPFDATETAVGPTVHASEFGFSDDGRAAVVVTGATYSAAATNYTGALGFIATRAPGTIIPGKVAGVSEVSAIHARKLFVNAPGATPAGVYYVTY